MIFFAARNPRLGRGRGHVAFRPRFELFDDRECPAVIDLYPGGAPGDFQSKINMLQPRDTLLVHGGDFPGYGGGTRVAAADFNRDGVADLVAGIGPGGASLVRILDGASGVELCSIAPFEASFVGDVYVAAGDLTGDGIPDLIVTPRGRSTLCRRPRLL